MSDYEGIKNFAWKRFLFPFNHFAKFHEESSKINMSRTLRLMTCIKLFSVFLGVTSEQETEGSKEKVSWKKSYFVFCLSLLVQV